MATKKTDSSPRARTVERHLHAMPVPKRGKNRKKTTAELMLEEIQKIRKELGYYE